MGLKLENVKKMYGEKIAVEGITLEMNKPRRIRIASEQMEHGKTTTIRMILGILKKGSGEVSWNGKTIDRKNVNFGYLPEERGIYPKTKVYDQLIYFARLKGMEKQEADKEVKKWAEKLKVSEYLEQPAEKLSKGNQQKVQFITAVLHNPELIILDEPFSGLDPVNAETVKNVILELVKERKIYHNVKPPNESSRRILHRNTNTK